LAHAGCGHAGIPRCAPRPAQGGRLARHTGCKPHRRPALGRCATRWRSAAAPGACGRQLAGSAPGRVLGVCRPRARPGGVRLPPGDRIGDPRRRAGRRRRARAERAARLRHGLRFLPAATRAPGARVDPRVTTRPTPEAPMTTPASNDPHAPRRIPADVVLLSAGPGDLELLTLKAVRALQAAEVLLLDELVDPGIVELAPHARVVRVGK